MSWSFSIQFFIPEHAAVVLTHIWFERQDAGDIVEAICSQCIGGICRSTKIEVLLVLPENLCQRKSFWLADENKLVFTWFSHYLRVYSLVGCCIRSWVELLCATIAIIPLHFPSFPLMPCFVYGCVWGTLIRNYEGCFVQQFNIRYSILLTLMVTDLTLLLYTRQQFTLNLCFINTEETSEVSRDSIFTFWRCHIKKKTGFNVCFTSAYKQVWYFHQTRTKLTYNFCEDSSEEQIWFLKMAVSIFAVDKVHYLNAWVGNECCLVSHVHSGKHQRPCKGLVCHAIQ